MERNIYSPATNQEINVEASSMPVIIEVYLISKNTIVRAMKKKRYALILVMMHNLNITIYVIMIVLRAHIDFFKIEIYA